MTRLALLVVLLLVAAAALRVLARGVLEGLGGARGSRTPLNGVPMVRDPVCGTYVVRDRALVVAKGRDTVYFCSARCRDQYRGSGSEPRGSDRRGHTA